jgi:hypothetical protein
VNKPNRFHLAPREVNPQGPAGRDRLANQRVAAVAGPAGSAMSQMRLIIHVASIVGSKEGSVIVLDAADEDEAKNLHRHSLKDWSPRDRPERKTGPNRDHPCREYSLK